MLLQELFHFLIKKIANLIFLGNELRSDVIRLLFRFKVLTTEWVLLSYARDVSTEIVI